MSRPFPQNWQEYICNKTGYIKDYVVVYVADKECKPLKILGKEKNARQKSNCHKGSKRAETYMGRTQAESMRV